MTWDEFQTKQMQTINIFNDSLVWVDTQVECPNCGGHIYKNISLVLTSYPPKYRYKCSKCEWEGTGY